MRVDINGAKGPNKVGHDIFTFHRFEGGIQPDMFNSSAETINSYCARNSSGDSCLAKLMRDGWQFNNDYGCW